MYQIHPSTEPYSKLIVSAIAHEFPTRCVHDAADLVDLLSAEILGTKQQRYGPKPSVESQVAIRDVVRIAIDRSEPIPFMVPWGSEKPNGGGIDLAEMWALKMMRCLSCRIAAHYEHGAIFRVRAEDASAPHLFFENKDKARADAKVYCEGLERLVSVLDYGNTIQIVRESSLVSEEEFAREADKVMGAVGAYLMLPSSGMKALWDLGWVGVIGNEVVMYYVDRCAKLYPESTHGQRLQIVARYLAAALARKRLGIRGDHPSWKGQFLDLSFVTPIPGTADYFNRRVYYRTMPSSITSNHMPPWRAKGHFVINGDDEAAPKLASFCEPQEYNHNTVTLVNGDNSVTVQADYIVS